MAIIAKTLDPEGLLAAIRRVVENGPQSQSEALQGWAWTAAGLQHCGCNGAQDVVVNVGIEQAELWLSPRPIDLTQPFSDFSYAFHHGNIVQFLLLHCWQQIERVVVAHRAYQKPPRRSR